MLTYALWFFLGALVHKILSYALSLGHNLIIFENTTDSILSIVDAISKDVDLAAKMKHRHLKGTELPDKIINNIEESDKKFLNDWKSVIINTMLANTPRTFHRYVKYTSWEEAQPRVRQLRANRREGK
tara:strand:+ start:306 stop:689 length:384 start_codon:yes stop_codon:yes gene_type:complete